MTLAQTIVSDVVTLRERLVVIIPSSLVTCLLTLPKGENIRAYWYDSSSQSFYTVLMET